MIEWSLEDAVLAVLDCDVMMKKRHVARYLRVGVAVVLGVLMKSCSGRDSVDERRDWAGRGY